MHRGMRDILLAFGKLVMNKFRDKLAALIKRTIKEKRQALYRDGVGYDMRYVNGSMGDMAESAILKGSGDSPDLVRVVTDVVRVFLDHKDLDQNLDDLDEVVFWRRNESSDLELDQDPEAVHRFDQILCA